MLTPEKETSENQHYSAAAPRQRGGSVSEPLAREASGDLSSLEIVRERDAQAFGEGIVAGMAGEAILREQQGDARDKGRMQSLAQQILRAGIA